MINRNVPEGNVVVHPWWHFRKHLWILPLCVLSCSKEPAETPEAAYVQMASSWQASDGEGFRRVVFSKDQKLIDGIVEIIGMNKRLEAVIDSTENRWGSDKDLSALRPRKESVQTNRPVGTASIDGDSATLLLSNGKPGSQLTTAKFKKIRGGWKLDCDAYFFSDASYQKELPLMEKGLLSVKKTGNCLHEIEVEIVNRQIEQASEGKIKITECLRTFSEEIANVRG